MFFALGYIAGVLTSLFIAVVLLFFKKPLIQVTTQIEKAVENAGPRPRGFIVNPVDDAEAVRQDRIRENSAQGKDTPISELL